MGVGKEHTDIAEGKIEKIGEDSSIVSHKNCTNNKSIKDEEKEAIKDHNEGTASFRYYALTICSNGEDH